MGLLVNYDDEIILSYVSLTGAEQAATNYHMLHVNLVLQQNTEWMY